MSVELVMRRSLSSLVPVDEISEEVLRDIPQGKEVRVKITQPRNIKHSRQYWALVNAIYPHQETYATIQSLHCAIKVALGYGESVKLPDGRIVLIPGSVSFGRMDEIAFSQFYDRVVALICEKILPGLGKDELTKYVNEIMEGNSPPRSGAQGEAA